MRRPGFSIASKLKSAQRSAEKRKTALAVLVAERESRTPNDSDGATSGKPAPRRRKSGLSGLFRAVVTPMMRADMAFSREIRERAGACAYRDCAVWDFDQLECSHYFRRNKYATRYDPANADAFCHDHHVLMETEKRPDGTYTKFMRGKLGSASLERLRLKSESRMKKTEAIAEFWERHKK